jgi:hypothetical protein
VGPILHLNASPSLKFSKFSKNFNISKISKKKIKISKISKKFK